MNEYLHAFTKLEFDKVRKLIERHAISELGREHCTKMVPSASLSRVRGELTLVSEAKNLLIADEPLPLDSIPDVRECLHHSSIESFILPAEELGAIAAILETSAKVSAYFTRRRESYLLLSGIAGRITSHKMLLFNIQRAIDQDGHVRDSASRELADVRRRIIDAGASLRTMLERILKSVADQEWAQDEILTTREGRMVIPVKVEHKNRVNGFIHSSSASGATVFVEPSETLEMNNEIRTLHFREEREIQKILAELTSQVREVKDAVLVNVLALGEMDFILARARYSIEVLGSEPKVSDGGRLRLDQAYHPLLLRKHKRQDVVPLSIEIESPVSVVIITGPNAGGKTVAMKTVGLLSLLAQSGCHIPAAPDSELPLFGSVFVDMGDEQSIEDDLSSFSSHLANLKVILENASQSSLVLIDEIGSGTDPSEGAAIAAGALNRLAASGCITIATTHHGALKTVALESGCFQNAAMEFDIQTLRPTYRYRSGVPGSSYAIEMAERMKLPDEVLIYAREMKGSASNRLEDLLIELERKMQELNTQLEVARKEREDYTKLAADYRSKIGTLEKEIRTIRTQAVQDAQVIIQKANSTIEELVRKIRESSAERRITQEARRAVEELSREFRSMEESLAPAETKTVFSVGDRVRLKGGTAEGEVLERYGNDSYLVAAGALRMKVKGGDLEKERQGGANVAPCRDEEFTPSGPPSNEVDLRGMYAEDAIRAIDKFFDDAVVNGLHSVSIIHGKGTGALRRKITDYLQHHAAIKSFRLGEWNEGGSGVTVVELK